METKHHQALEPKPITSAAMFIGLCNLRGMEGSLRWQGAQLGFWLNLPALAAAMMRLTTSPAIKELLFIGLGGFVCCGINWFLHEVIKRDGKYVDLWNDLLADVERANKTEGGVSLFDSPKFNKLRRSRDRLQDRLQRLIISCIVAWGVIAVFALGMIFGVR